MDFLKYTISIASFVGVVVVVYAIASLTNPYRFRVRNRMNNICDSAVELSGHGISQTTDSGSNVFRLFGFLQELYPRKSETRPLLHRRLEKAGIYARAAEQRYHAARMLSAVAMCGATFSVGSLAGWRGDLTILYASILAACGSLLPSFWLDRAIHHHHLLLRKSLPDFLDVMIVCLQGGMSLQETIRRVGDELRLAHPALALELSFVQSDMELGATVDQALKRFANRTDYEGVRTLSTFIREAQRFGTNIIEALRSHADMLRSQREQAAEENAQKASVKILLPTMFLIFPAIFVVAVGPAVIQIIEAFAAE